MSRDQEACSDLHTECVAQPSLYTGHRQPCVPPSDTGHVRCTFTGLLLLLAVLIFIEGTPPPCGTSMPFSTSLRLKLSVTKEQKRGGNEEMN